MDKVRVTAIVLILFFSMFSVLLPKGQADSATLKTVWKYPVTDNVTFVSDIGDADGDGFPDVAVLNAHWPSGPATVQVLKNDGTTLWTTSINFAGTGIAVEDTNLDSKAEVYVFGTTGVPPHYGDPILACFDANGNRLWQFTRHETSPWSRDIDWVSFVNLDLDPQLEIFCGGGGWADYINYALDANGVLMWVFTTRDIGSDWKIGDVNGDGADEIVLFTFQEVYILSKSGVLLQTIRPHTTSAWAHGALGDVDGDGVDEIVVSVKSYDISYNFVNTLFVYKGDGTLLWQKNYLQNPDGTPMNPILIDLTGDGIQDVVVLANKMINAYKNDGTPLWAFSDINPTQPWNVLITNFDLIKGDNKDEILFQSDQGLYILSLNGELIKRFDVPNQGRWVQSGHIGKDPRVDNPYYEFGDVNNDGINELIMDEVIDGQHYVAVISIEIKPRIFDPFNDGFSFRNFGFFYTTKEEVYNAINNNPLLSQLSGKQKEMLTQIVFYLLKGVNWGFDTLGVGGHCYGMSAAARYYFLNPEEPEPNKVWDMSFEEAAPKIRELQLSFYVNPYFIGKIFRLYFNNPIVPQTDNLAELSQIQSLIEDEGVALVLLQNSFLETLEIWKSHAVLAYKIDKTPNGWTLWVYDPNSIDHDGHYITRYIEIDSDGSLSYTPTYVTIEFHQIGAIASDATVFNYLLTFLRRIYSIVVHSPANAFVTDPLGRSIGTDPETGSIINQMPNAVYSGPYTEPQFILIFDPPKGMYNILLAGTAGGDYTLTIEYITAEQTTSQTFTGTISQSEQQYYSAIISETEEMTAISWDYVFKDLKRGTMLKISTDDNYFQFVAPDKDFGIKHDANMKVFNHIILIRYEDDEMRIVATAVDDCINFCSAIVKDKQTGKYYMLIDKPNWPKCCRERFTI